MYSECGNTLPVPIKSRLATSKVMLEHMFNVMAFSSPSEYCEMSATLGAGWRLGILGRLSEDKFRL